ncbi:MAG: ankyrin repeat domain-containing protein [Candidatus Aminicenantes bacterium]|nr:ankyrin repeat domain-containing protein [Candidatus Aminicenantes bacterium]
MMKKILVGILFLFLPIANFAVDNEIIRAAQAGNAAKIEALLSANPELINVTDSGMGATALHWAAIYGRKNAIAVLLRYVSDVNASEKHDGTAMHWAAHCDDAEVIEWLLDKGARIDHQNEVGRTPLHVAARRGCTEVVKKLIAKGADIRTLTKNGDSALHIAARNGHQDTVDLLIAHGVSKEVKNNQGSTYLDVLFTRPKTITLDPEIFDDYAGVYSVKPNWNLYIRKEDDHLYYYAYGKDELLPVSENQFMSDAELLSFTFLRDENGEVREVIYKSPSGEQKGTKLDRRKSKK